MAPVKPSEIKALIINASDPPCTQWKKLLKTIYLWYKMRNYENAEDGGITDEYAEDICDALVDCAAVDGTPEAIT